MQKKLLLLLLWTIAFAFSAKASHIVGGEIDLQRVTDAGSATHRLSLNLYFDDINGRAAALDNAVTVGIFRKRDNAVMGYVTLPLTVNELLTYTNPSCQSNASLRTRYLRYTNLIIMSSSVFNDAQGYYIVWDRCCRNTIISNIVNPISTSSIFYTEFAPLEVNGKAFVNSTPLFGKLTGDYICINRPFAFDFSATDADGDSLVYSIVTPLRGLSSTNNPSPQFPTGSSNYPTVTWAAGYSSSNSIPGSKPLTVDRKTGVLNVTANRLGLYVFCVLTEEYRDGKKIGAVRRDFQLMVIDCPINNSPKNLVKIKGSNTFYTPGQTITFSKTQTERCLDFYITDPNPLTQLTIKTISVNFQDGNLSKIPSNFYISSTADTLKAQVCLDACTESIDGKPLELKVVTADDGCPQPLYDTLTVKLYIEPNPNTDPTVNTDLGKSKVDAPVNATIKFNVLGLDNDNDQVTVVAVGRGFNLSDVGMAFATTTGQGKTTTPFSWTPQCANVRTTDYVVDFIITDYRCGKAHQKDTVTVSFKPVSTPSNSPEISSTLTQKDLTYLLDGQKTTVLDFNIISKDIDNDPLLLYALPQNFKLADVGAQWADKSGVGSVTSPFSWALTCNLLNRKDTETYKIYFVTEDNSCSPNRYDTLQVNVTLKNATASYDFKPSNVITPNNDGKNDYFDVADLPENNCFEQFEYIQITNRWGQTVFKSSDRKFKWYADDVSASDYYYVLKFTNRMYKGWVTVLKP